MSTHPERTVPNRDAERRRVLLAVGPQLRDVEAAVHCPCSCHPRPASDDLHEGGARCACQLTAEERRKAFDELLSLSAELGLDEAFDAEAAEFAATADELGVDARIRVPACPLVVTGTVDGQAFYYRERHDLYRVQVPTGDRDVDLYDQHDHPSQTLVEATGHLSPAQALSVSVAAVRDQLRREACPHRDARAFCPDCGTRTAP